MSKIPCIVNAGDFHYYKREDKKIKPPENPKVFEAGVVRIELTSKVLETPILPLNHTPMY